MSPAHWQALKDFLFPILATQSTASLIHSFFPPWDAEAFQPFPTFQKYYRAFIYVVGYFAINLRSTVYKSISTENPNSPNASVKTLNGGSH